MSTIAWNVQPIVDSMLTVAGTGKPVYFRVANFNETAEDLNERDQLGFIAVNVTGGDGSEQEPFTDILIQPQPRVKQFSMYTIGQSMGKLDESSRLIVVSHTAVLALMALSIFADVTNPEQLFNGETSLVGLVTDGRVFNVVQAWHREVGGQTTSWRLICNATT